MRSSAGSDLPVGPRPMTGSDDDKPAARGPPLGARARRSEGLDDDTPAVSCPPVGARARLYEGSESSHAWCPADFPGQTIFTGCTVHCHEEVPRHIYGLFEALGIQYSWVLTRGPLGRAIVTAEDLVINNSKERSWLCTKALYDSQSPSSPTQASHCILAVLARV